MDEQPEAKSTGAYSLRDHIRNHRVHALVVLAFALYPLIHGMLAASPVGSEVNAFLPGLTFMIIVLYMGLFAMSFDFISGYTGYLSFGHAAFYGTSAYFVVLVTNGNVPFFPETTPFMILLVVGSTLAMLLAFLIGAVSFRLTGVYFAMITLGVAQVMYEGIRNWDYVAVNPQEGPTLDESAEIGIPFVETLSVEIGRFGDSFTDLLGLGIDISATTVSYYAIGLVVLLSYLAMQRIIHSPFGRVMIAIRENEARAKAIGYNTYWYKMVAFGISAFFGGVAGALFAGYARAISPENTYFFLVTADALITAIIGGLGTLAGPLFGTAFHQWLEDMLSTDSGGIALYLRDVIPESVLEAEVVGISLELLINAALDGRAPLYLGIVFVLFVLFVPNGILGSLRDRLGGTVADRLPEHLDRYRR